MHTQRIERGAQHILVLVERSGFEAFLYSGANSKRDHMTAAVCGIGVEAFVKDKDQDAILLNPGLLNNGAILFLSHASAVASFTSLVQPVGAVGQSCALWFWFGTTKE